jgi:hypothetical protein
MQLSHPEGKRRPGRPPTEPRFDHLSGEQRAALAAHLRLNRSNLHRYIRISDIMLSRGLGGGELPLRIFKRLSAWLEAHEPTPPAVPGPTAPIARSIPPDSPPKFVTRGPRAAAQRGEPGPTPLTHLPRQASRQIRSGPMLRQTLPPAPETYPTSSSPRRRSFSAAAAVT